MTLVDFLPAPLEDLAEDLANKVTQALNVSSFDPFPDLAPQDPVARITEDDKASDAFMAMPSQAQELTIDRMTSTPREQRQAEQTYAKQTPGSSAAFQAAEAATKPQKLTSNQFTMRALAQKGEEYEWGGTTEASGFDCSGLIYRIMVDHGMPNFPRTSGEIYEHSKKISVKKALQTRGAILYTPGHIAISLGNGKTIEARGEAYGVVVADGRGRFQYGGILPELRMVQARKALKKVARKTRSVAMAKSPEVLASSDFVAANSGLTNATFAFASVLQEVKEGRPNKAQAASQVRLSDKDAILRYARRMAAAMGWSGAQWQALYELGMRESGWDPTAVNPTSGATGIPQLLPSAHSIPKHWKNPKVQVDWFLNYVANRYGSPAAALRHHDRMNWY